MKADLQPVRDGGFSHPLDPGELGYRIGAARHTPRVSVSEREAKMLTLLASRCVVLEIGTGLGVSTRALAQDAAAVVTIDTDPWVLQEIRSTLPGNVEFVSDRSECPLYRFDLAFVDGNHEPESVIADVTFALAKLRTGGLLLAHDFNAAKVSKAARSVVKHWSVLKTEYGIGVAVA